MVTEKKENKKENKSKNKNMGCGDKNCPFHGSLRTRGKVFEGVVKNAKMYRTATIEWSYLHYLPKYERYEKRYTKIKAHVPACMSVKAGDFVKVAECRPLAKTVSFVVIEKLEKQEKEKQEEEQGIKSEVIV
ncbi:MAG: 30S ribosomal protein S17 [Candidatus Nanoarchaeia archaeon]